MLIHAQPDLVSKHWDFLAPHIARALPEHVREEQGMAAVLRSILLERLHVWAYDKDDKIIFLGTTTFTTDPITRDKWLLIYSISAIEDIQKDMLVDSYETIYKFAKKHGAVAIRAYSNVPGIIKWAKTAGARTDMALLEFPI